MNITRRLFTYPVLNEDKDDYKTSKFEVDFKYTQDSVSTLKFLFDITMTCPELEDMINVGQAEYVIHLECSTTAYREVLHSVSTHVEYTIPISRVNGSLDVVAFIILKKNISSFVSADWEDDYKGMTFSLSQGSILAYQNLDSLDITKDYEEFTNAGSIFTVYKRLTDDDTPAEISLDSPKLMIGLGSKDYDVYANYASQNELQAIINSMIILPALVYIFEELKQEGGYDTYHNKEWFMALEKAYQKRSLDFMDQILNTEKTSYQLAQEAMELPLSKALTQIPVLYSLRDEEDE